MDLQEGTYSYVTGMIYLEIASQPSLLRICLSHPEPDGTSSDVRDGDGNRILTFSVARIALRVPVPPRTQSEIPLNPNTHTHIKIHPKSSPETKVRQNIHKKSTNR